MHAVRPHKVDLRLLKVVPWAEESRAGRGRFGINFSPRWERQDLRGGLKYRQGQGTEVPPAPRSTSLWGPTQSPANLSSASTS